MASLDHSSSTTIMNTVWQSTHIDMSRFFVSSGQHLVDGKWSSGSASGYSRTVSPQLISRKCDQQWSPYSLDLNPPNFYLWGYLKDWVYVYNPQSIPDLKRAIKTTIKAIPMEECKKFIDNFVRRIKVCLQRQGDHLSTIFEL